MKAGGIDLLDLLKENLLAPRNGRQPRGIPELDAIAEDRTAACASGRWSRWPGSPAIRSCARATPAPRRCGSGSASPQIRNVATLGGNLLQRPRCWYFRAAEYHCLRKGGDHCFALSGENQYHAIFDNRPCAIVHPSTAATVLVALGAEVELANARGRRRRVRLEDFFVPPDGTCSARTISKPHEILTAIELAAAAGERCARRI